MDDQLNTTGEALTIDAAQRKALKAQAHPLKPVVMVGEAGLTPAVMTEIELALASHSLIKIRVFGDDREARAGMLASICGQTGSAPVQHIGKLLVVWRPAPEGPVKTLSKGRARPNAPYHPKKAAGAGQAAPTRRAPRKTREVDSSDTRATPRSDMVRPLGRKSSGAGGKPQGRATTLGRGAAIGKAGAPGASAREAGKDLAGKPAPRTARRVYGAIAPVGKPARPGRAPALSSPGAKVRSPVSRKR